MSLRRRSRSRLQSYILTGGATAPAGMAPAMHMVSPDHLVYGIDCRVPCSTELSMEANKKAVFEYEDLSKSQHDAIGRDALSISQRDWRSDDGLGNLLAVKML